jgi:hypothetical protein
MEQMNSILSGIYCILRSVSGHIGIERCTLVWLFLEFWNVRCMGGGSELREIPVLALSHATNLNFLFVHIWEWWILHEASVELLVSDMVPWIEALSLRGFFQVESAFLLNLLASWSMCYVVHEIVRPARWDLVLPPLKLALWAYFYPMSWIETSPRFRIRGWSSLLEDFYCHLSRAFCGERLVSLRRDPVALSRGLKWTSVRCVILNDTSSYISYPRDRHEIPLHSNIRPPLEASEAGVHRRSRSLLNTNDNSSNPLSLSSAEVFPHSLHVGIPSSGLVCEASTRLTTRLRDPFYTQ